MIFGISFGQTNDQNIDYLFTVSFSSRSKTHSVFLSPLFTSMRLPPVICNDSNGGMLSTTSKRGSRANVI